MRGFHLISFVLACGLVAAVGCASSTNSGGGGGGGINTNVVYDPPKNLTSWEFVDTLGNGKVVPVSVRIAGTKTIAGKDFVRVQVGKMATYEGDPAADYVEIWGQPDGTGIVFAGGEIHSPASVQPGGGPGVTLEVNPPVRLETNIEVNTPEYVTATSSLFLGDPATVTPITGTQTGQIVLVSKAESVVTGIGTLTGASHYTGEVTVNGQKATGEAWLVSGKGLVAAKGSWPGFPGDVHEFTLGLAGTGGVTVSGDHHIAERETLINAANTKFSIDTYDLDGGFYADKATHANMLLELRWADPEMAKTSTPPPVSIDFGTAIGYYPASLTDVPVSALHPEENGKGYLYWSALVNQAAKNEPGTTTSYHIKATYTGAASAGDVRASGQLNYRYLKP